MSPSNQERLQVAAAQDDIIELSDTDLDQVSGGLDVTISGAFFKQETDISSDMLSLDCGSSLSSVSYTQKTSIFAFQVVTSFKSSQDVMNFMVGLGEALKRRGFL